MEPRLMKNGMVVSTMLLILLLAMGCATMETAKHQYFMRGQVLEVRDGTAYLCLGTEQGAQVGQVFAVKRYVRIGLQRGGQPQYKVDSVGTVRITEVESHMANASIVSGDVRANDIVELTTSNP
jgi:hypothetical protein